MPSPELPMDHGTLKLEVERGAIRFSFVQTTERENAHEGCVAFKISPAQLRRMAEAMLNAADTADRQMPPLEAPS